MKDAREGGKEEGLIIEFFACWTIETS
jgi:hypothetical protein